MSNISQINVLVDKLKKDGYNYKIWDEILSMKNLVFNTDDKHPVALCVAALAVNSSESLTLIKSAVACNEPIGIFMMGMMHDENCEVLTPPDNFTRDINKAEQYYTKAFELGILQAGFELAYLDLPGVDYEKHKFEWLKKVYDAGYEPAAYQLAHCCYTNGKFSSAIKYCVASTNVAKRGELLYILASSLDEIIGTPAYKQTFILYMEAHILKCGDATYALAMCYIHGYGVNKNIESGIMLLESFLNGSGSHLPYTKIEDIYLQLGLLYKETSKKVEMFKKAAACDELIKMYDAGSIQLNDIKYINFNRVPDAKIKPRDYEIALEALDNGTASETIVRALPGDIVYAYHKNTTSEYKVGQKRQRGKN